MFFVVLLKQAKARSQWALERVEDISCHGIMVHRYSVDIVNEDPVDFVPMGLGRYEELFKGCIS